MHILVHTTVQDAVSSSDRCDSAGIFGRACAAIGGDKSSDTAVKRESVLQEATALRESLTDKLISLKSSQGTGIGMLLPPCMLERRLSEMHIQHTSLAMLSLSMCYKAAVYKDSCEFTADLVEVF